MRDKEHDAKIKKVVGELLDAKRLEVHLSYEDLAKATGLSTGAIYNVMHGVHNTSPATLDKIVQAMDWSLGQLFFEVDAALGRHTPTDMVRIRELLTKAPETEARTPKSDDL